jgi:hypothetical protein
MIVLLCAITRVTVDNRECTRSRVPRARALSTDGVFDARLSVMDDSPPKKMAWPPIIIRPPIAREFLNRRELHALRFIRDRFPVRPLCRVYAPAQVGKFRFRNIHTKRTNNGLITDGLLCTFSHCFRPFCGTPEDLAGPQQRLPLQHRKSDGD